MEKTKQILPGLGLCILIGGGVQFLSPLIPGLGSTTLALLFGIVAGNLLHRFRLIQGGSVLAEKKILPLAIALLGVQLRLQELGAIGWPALILILVVVPGTIFLGYGVGRLLGHPPLRALLLGAGNAVCGSSAIASVGRVVDASEEDLGLTIAAVNFMGTLGLFLLPAAASLPALTSLESAAWLGGSLQAVGHVVAAGYGMGEDVGAVAVLIKMGRVLLLGPVVVVVGLIFRKRTGGGDSSRRREKFPVPLFIVGFFLASLAASFLPLGEGFLGGVEKMGKLLLNTAMAGVGMKILFRVLVKQGPKVLLAEGLIGISQVVGVLILAILLF